MSFAGAYLHERDALHRDLKCSNVLVNQSFRCKIADFGLSRVIDQKHTKVWFGVHAMAILIVQSQCADSCSAFLAAGPTTATCCQALKKMGPMEKSMISAAVGSEQAANHARPKLKRQLTRK